MRNARAKRIVNETDKYLLGPFDDSLVQIQLDKNEKCIAQINKNNFERAQQFIKQLRKDGQMISSYNRQKYIIKCLSLNTEAYYYQKQKMFQEALKCLQESEAIEDKQITSPIDIARTKLNKSVVLSNLGKHEQAIQIAKKALELLKNKKNLQYYEIHKNQYKLYQIMIISFYNIASSLSHLKDFDEANKIYMEGYYLGQKMLGSKNKLTIMLKQIVKQNKRKAKKTEQIEEISDLKSLRSNKSQGKEKFHVMNLFQISKYSKEEELKRIYAYRSKKNYTTIENKSKKTFTVNLSSLEKIKKMQNQKKVKFSKILRLSTQNTYKSKARSNNKNKSITEGKKNNRYSESLKKEMSSSSIRQLELNNKSNFKLKSLEKLSPNPYKSSFQKLPQRPSAKINDNPMTVEQIVDRVQQSDKKEKEACQLI